MMGGYSVEEIASTLFFWIILLLPVFYTLAGLLDAARRPAWVWALVGRSQLLWLWLLGMSLLTIYGGVIAATWYFVRVRRSLVRAEAGDLT